MGKTEDLTLVAYRQPQEKRWGGNQRSREPETYGQGFASGRLDQQAHVIGLES